MGAIALGVQMRPSAFLLDQVQAAPPARLEVRLCPIERPMPGIPQTAKWAWAIMQVQPGKQDVILVGGHAESYTEAAARGAAELELQGVKFNG